MKDVSRGFSVSPLCSREEPLEKEHIISLRIGRVTVFFLGGGVLIFRSNETDSYYDVMNDEFSGNG